MRSALKALLVTGSLVAASLGGAASAVAATAPPTLITTNFACSNGVCEVGPGNVGMSFAAGMYGTGGPTCTPGPCNGSNGNNFVMSVVSGSLPPGLQLDNTFSGLGGWAIDGTPPRQGRTPSPCRSARTRLAAAGHPRPSSSPSPSAPATRTGRR